MRTKYKKDKEFDRKLQHSEIERKRRCKVNHRFDQLRELINNSGFDIELKANDFKLQVLDHTVESMYILYVKILLTYANQVDYIHHLKSELDKLNYIIKQGNSNNNDLNSDESMAADVLISLRTPESPFSKLSNNSQCQQPPELTLPPSSI